MMVGAWGKQHRGPNRDGNPTAHTYSVKRSIYSRQALPQQTYFHQPQTGDIAQHLPKEIIRVERDWSDGEVCQYVFPLIPRALIAARCSLFAAFGGSTGLI
jgi:hypothetical protein